MLEKKCKGPCQRTLPLSEFYKNKHAKDRRDYACRSCKREKARQWHLENPGRRREMRVRNRRKAPERIKGHNLIKYWPGYSWLEALNKYTQMFESQQGLCAICRRPERLIDPRNGQPRLLAVDHDHRTNQVRGLLCGNCNNGIGRLGDSVELISSALQYIKEYSK